MFHLPRVDKGSLPLNGGLLALLRHKSYKPRQAPLRWAGQPGANSPVQLIDGNVQGTRVPARGAGRCEAGDVAVGVRPEEGRDYGADAAHVGAVVDLAPHFVHHRRDVGTRPTSNAHEGFREPPFRPSRAAVVHENKVDFLGAQAGVGRAENDRVAGKGLARAMSVAHLQQGAHVHPALHDSVDAHDHNQGGGVGQGLGDVTFILGEDQATCFGDGKRGREDPDVRAFEGGHDPVSQGVDQRLGLGTQRVSRDFFPEGGHIPHGKVAQRDNGVGGQVAHGPQKVRGHVHIDCVQSRLLQRAPQADFVQHLSLDKGNAARARVPK